MKSTPILITAFSRRKKGISQYFLIRGTNQVWGDCTLVY